MSITPLHPGEKAAQNARAELRLSRTEPLHDLLTVVEDRLGLPVMFDRFEDPKIAGVLLQRHEGVFIVINADKEFGSPRQRFTLAHEVGHVRMGHQPRIDLADDVFGDTRDEQEVAANYFAAEFIAPRAAVVAWLEERELSSAAAEAETIVRFGLSFGLSFPATCIRFQRAGVVSRAHAERLAQEAAQRGTQLARQYSGFRLMDSIEHLWRADGYPRPPREAVELANAAREAGLLDDDEYAAIIPTGTEEDYPFTGWTA